MPETNQNFDIYAGETHSFVVTVVDKDNDDAPVDLTGASVTWILKNGSTTVLTKTVGVGITLATDPTTGVFTIAWVAANGSSLSGVYQHEARVTLSGGTIATVLTGTLTVHTTLV